MYCFINCIQNFKNLKDFFYFLSTFQNLYFLKKELNHFSTTVCFFTNIYTFTRVFFFFFFFALAPKLLLKHRV